MLILSRKGWVADAVNPTNLLTKNQSDVETDATGFVISGGVGTTLARDTAVAWQGAASLKVTTPDATNWRGVRVGPFTVEAGRTYHVSAHIIGAVGGEKIKLGGSTGGAWAFSSPTHTLTASPQRYSASVAPATGSSNYYFEIGQSGAAASQTWFVDGLQVEKDQLGRWVPGQTRRTRKRLVL
jgi:hypothetical protein